MQRVRGHGRDIPGRKLRALSECRGLCLHHRSPYIVSAGATFFARLTLRFTAFLRPAVLRVAALRPGFFRVTFFAALRPAFLRVTFFAALRLAGFFFLAVIGM